MTQPIDTSIYADVTEAIRSEAKRILSEGQTLLVQVVKDPLGTKGARLSTQRFSPADRGQRRQ